jgi:hypothetical protein
LAIEARWVVGQPVAGDLNGRPCTGHVGFDAEQQWRRLSIKPKPASETAQIESCSGGGIEPVTAKELLGVFGEEKKDWRKHRKMQ